MLKYQFASGVTPMPLVFSFPQPAGRRRAFPQVYPDEVDADRHGRGTRLRHDLADRAPLRQGGSRPSPVALAAAVAAPTKVVIDHDTARHPQHHQLRRPVHTHTTSGHRHRGPRNDRTARVATTMTVRSCSHDALQTATRASPGAGRTVIPVKGTEGL
jgi:hypothetical protein